MIANYLKAAVIAAIKTRPSDANWLYRVTDAVYLYLCPASPVFMFNVGYGHIERETYIAATLSAREEPDGSFSFLALAPTVDAGTFKLGQEHADINAWPAIEAGLVKALSRDEYLELLGLSAELQGKTEAPADVKIDDLGGI